MASKKSAGSKPKSISVMDVSKPGKTPPDASSRPIIVGHRPMVKDTSVSLPPDKQDSQPDDEPIDEGEKIQVSRTSPKVIQPPTDMEAEQSEENSEKPEPEAEQPSQAEESTQRAQITDSESGEDLTAEPSQEEPQPTSEEAATVDAVASQAPDHQAEARQTEAERKKQEHLNQLISDKKYQLPIRSTKRRRRTGWLALLLVVVLLLAAGFYVLRYTNLIDTSAYNLPSWLTGQDSQDDDNQEHEAESHSQEDTSATPVPDAEDAQRKNDINAIAAALETYHTTNGHYPSLGQLNDPDFRADNLAGLDIEAYQDPDGDSNILAVSSSSGIYGYTTTPVVCDNETDECAAFILTATLSDDQVYEKMSLN